MASHSVDDILAQLKDRPMTRGWGAVAAFSRERLNAMLAQQFTEGFNAANFLPLLSGETHLDSGSTTVATFDSIIFGAPTLSFEKSHLSDSMATFTIPLIGGDFTRVFRSPQYAPQLISKARITEAMGYTLKMEIRLRGVGSSVDDVGRISISPFHEPLNPRCNLVGEAFSQGTIGDFMLDHLKELPLHRSMYTLGLLDAGDHAPLNPTGFTMLTHAAPGATRADAPNHGDGAVLFFLKLKGWENDEVSLPDSDASFPYLIPDDMRDGKPLHTAALLITRKLAHFVDDKQLGVLSESLLPAGYAFRESADARHTPHDVVVFGNLVTTEDLVTIEPLVTSLREAKSQQFTARDGTGNVVQAAAWSSESITRPLASGTISATGLYRAVSEAVVGNNVLPTVVTAHYSRNGRQRQASALVMARFETLNVSPLASVASPNHSPTELVASSVSNGTLRWRLMAPAWGTLTDLGNGRAEYTPPASMDVKIAAERIEVRDEGTNEAVEAVVVLVTEGGLTIEPPLAGALTGRGQYGFEVPQASLEALLATHGITNDQIEFRWRLIGDGSISAVDRTAAYTPPATLSALPVTVVVCELDTPAFKLMGFSVIELTHRQREYPTWTGLQAFSLEATQGQQAYANGMQQIPVTVTIETSKVTIDGVDYFIPISLVELASLRLADLSSKLDVPFVDLDVEGIEHDSSLVWATSDVRNRFRPFGSVTPPRSDQRSNNEEATRRRELLIHLANPVAPEFFARFDDSNYLVWESLKYSVQNTVKVQGMAVPTPTLEDYTFEYDRVWNGEGDIVGDDIFNYMLESVDFWRLGYRRMGVAVGFSSLKIEGNTSTLQYESELMDETFVSFTGSSFIPIVHNGNRPAEPTTLAFDPYLTSMFNTVAHAPPDDNFWDQPPTPGELLVSNHRAADLPYWYDGMSEGDELRQYRTILDRPVKYVLRDEDGNRHSLQIGYPNRSIADSRNQLILVRTQKT